MNIIILFFVDEQAEAQRGSMLLGVGRVGIQIQAYPYRYGVGS